MQPEQTCAVNNADTINIIEYLRFVASVWKNKSSIFKPYFILYVH